MSSFIAQPVVCANPSKEKTLGIVLSWVSDNLKSESIDPVMKKHGLDSFSPDDWYPTQTLLDAVRDFYKKPDAMDILVAIGKKFANEYPFEPNITSVNGALLGFNAAYHTLHIGVHADEGLLIDQTQPNTFVVTNNTPWPGETIFGMLSSLPARFEPRNSTRVKFLEPDDFLRTVFEVSWK